MELKFVEDKVVQSITRGRTGTIAPIVTAFIEELYKHPNKWAEFPIQISHTSQMYRIQKRFKDIEVRGTGGNNKATNDPDKKDWTVYMRFVPSETSAKKPTSKSPKKQ